MPWLIKLVEVTTTCLSSSARKGDWEIEIVKNKKFLKMDYVLFLQRDIVILLLPHGKSFCMRIC